MDEFYSRRSERALKRLGITQDKLIDVAVKSGDETICSYTQEYAESVSDLLDVYVELVNYMRELCEKIEDMAKEAKKK